MTRFTHGMVLMLLIGWGGTLFTLYAIASLFAPDCPTLPEPPQ